MRKQRLKEDGQPRVMRTIRKRKKRSRKVRQKAIDANAFATASVGPETDA